MEYNQHFTPQELLTIIATETNKHCHCVKPTDTPNICMTKLEFDTFCIDNCHELTDRIRPYAENFAPTNQNHTENPSISTTQTRKMTNLLVFLSNSQLLQPTFQAPLTQLTSMSQLMLLVHFNN